MTIVCVTFTADCQISLSGSSFLVRLGGGAEYLESATTGLVTRLVACFSVCSSGGFRVWRVRGFVSFCFLDRGSNSFLTTWNLDVG